MLNIQQTISFTCSSNSNLSAGAITKKKTAGRCNGINLLFLFSVATA
jgi:hypothetical protein